MPPKEMYTVLSGMQRGEDQLFVELEKKGKGGGKEKVELTLPSRLLQCPRTCRSDTTNTTSS